MIKAKYQQTSFTPWLKQVINSNECGTVIGLPNGGVNRIIQSTVDDLGESEHFGTIDLALTPKHKKEMISSLRQVLTTFKAQGVSLIKINNLKVYKKRGIRQLFALNSIRNDLGRKINYLFHLTFPPKADNPDIIRVAYSQLLFQNTYFIPFADGIEFDILINQLENRFSTKITPAIKEKIYSLSGGCPFIVKNLIKYCLDNSELDVTDPQLLTFANLVIADFRPILLTKIKLNKLTSLEIQSLIKLGFFDNKSVIRSQLLKQQVASTTLGGNLALDIKSGQILWQNQSINSDLAPHEVDILQKLLESNTITREDIASICYGSKESSDFSDSSIDKVMSRFRAHLIKSGLPSDTILTVKKIGYRINNAYLS